MHRLFTHDIPPVGQTLQIEGEEAHHCVRVKRVREGERVGLLDGSGVIALASVTTIQATRRGSVVEVLVDALEHRPQTRPAVDVLAPAPKGGALEQMIDQLSQVGAASWTPLRTARSEREPQSFDRLRRIALESAKQCGRAHLLEIRSSVDLAAALSGDGEIIVADAAGAPFTASDRDAVTLLVGPEGGWSDEERERIRGSRVRMACFGRHVMRIETAAVVAAAAILG